MPLSPPPRVVVFDLDDTLLDHRAAEHAALADVHRQHHAHLGHHPLEHVQQTYHRCNAPLWADFGAGRIDSAELRRLRSERTLAALGCDTLTAADFGRDYLDRYAVHWRWTDGARDAYHAVADAVPVGILTNGFSEQQRGKLATFPEIADRAAFVVISEEVGVMKPDPRLFEHVRGVAERATGSPLRPAEVVYVGDSFVSDVEGGTGAGWRVVWLGGDPERAPEGAVCADDWAAVLAELGL